MRIRLGKGFWASRWGLAILGTTLALLLTGIVMFTYYYIVYARMIDERLSGNIFQHTTGIYTQPGRIFNGQAINSANLEEYLGHSGYSAKKDPDGAGYYAARGNTLEIYPGKSSFFHGGNA
ncbi:MAG TPA: hypothetical protein VIH72_03415, partial [Candidatus Acidoferrales bacterium]